MSRCRMTDEQINCCRNIGRDEQENLTIIGLPEIDALCAEAIERGRERDIARRECDAACDEHDANEAAFETTLAHVAVQRDAALKRAEEAETMNAHDDAEWDALRVELAQAQRKGEDFAAAISDAIHKHTDRETYSEIYKTACVALARKP